MQWWEMKLSTMARVLSMIKLIGGGQGLWCKITVIEKDQVLFSRMSTKNNCQTIILPECCCYMLIIDTFLLWIFVRFKTKSCWRGTSVPVKRVWYCLVFGLDVLAGCTYPCLFKASVGTIERCSFFTLINTLLKIGPIYYLCLKF